MSPIKIQRNSSKNLTPHQPLSHSGIRFDEVQRVLINLFLGQSNLSQDNITKYLMKFHQINANGIVTLKFAVKPIITYVVW